MRFLDAALGAALGAMTLQAQTATPGTTVQLRRGMVITKSTTIAKRSYRLAAAASRDSALVVIRGDDITLDLNDATIEGTDPAANPDRAAGVAIRVDGGRNVTIQRGTIRGFRVAILARGTKNLTIQNTDLGHNWKPRLYSLVEHESLADWLSFHHNEQGEWLRFGAAIYLDGVTGGEVRINRAEQGMNGLLIVRTDSVRVVDNSFRFNSGLGIGLYRSSGNSILGNRLDFNVRGFSNGFYRRGQDSADLLLYEQSSHNIVAWNSATHGGDGLFLWAGQSTMDSGDGGANDNLFFGNDFSFAPTNAMEATFSRNTFAGNRAEGSDYGLWGGYSYDSKVVGNCFARNRVGIAIEHGQDNEISFNGFEGDGTAIRLWGDKVEPGDWGYPKHRDTESRNARIIANRFFRNRVAVNAASTRELTFSGNSLDAVDTTMVLKDTADMRIADNVVRPARQALEVVPCTPMSQLPAESRLAPQLEGVAAEVPRSALSSRDRSAIIVDEWGPYDWRSPKLWPVDSTHSVPLRLAVHGPAGRWRVAGRRGIASVSAMSGRMNDTVAVTPRVDSLHDWQITLEYKDTLAVTPRGTIVAPGTPMRFSFGTFEPAQSWDVKFFVWNDSTDPRGKVGGFAALLRGTPVARARADRLDYMWYRPAIAALPQAKWALEARSSVTLAPGAYTLRTISDDAVRVWVDGKLAIDDWKPHESAVDVAPLSAGRHELLVQYFQVDGWTELRLDIVRGKEMASGSPGPH
ncbi:MAG TPA: right-handed parallel beta-helix repeat-containing protein [Gemmatimonadaceae bacterium]